ncbi:MAG TPA: hypothetical protein VE987_09255 [Polyangiaceae bacterium]|nr:hypothetical protein [Polyangiaceae bacterium]
MQTKRSELGRGASAALNATVRASLAAVAACAALALAVQSCGVMSSSTDCAERANCPGPDGTSGADVGPGPEASNAETGGDDVTGDDGAGEAALDGPVADAPGGGDVEAGADGGRDVAGDVPRDVVAEEAAPPPDVCVDSGAEDCTNGVDDNCDGLVDCADPQCGAYGCAAPVPGGGWNGPVAFWQATNPVTVPSCPANYVSPVTGSEGLNAPPATCGNGTCAASGQTCSLTGVFHPDQACNNTACASVSPATDGSCTTVPANSCGTGGSFTVGTTAPAATGGSCSPQAGSVTKPAISWAMSAQMCSYGGPADSPGGCTVAGQQCVAKPNPTGGNAFGATFCVYSLANPAPAACPTGYTRTAAPTVFFDMGAVNDTRGCSLPSCGASPTSGSCSGTITLFGGAGCSGSNATYTLGTACGPYMNLTPLDPSSVQAHYTVTPGTCSVTAQPSPTGMVSPTTPVSICCM